MSKSSVRKRVQIDCSGDGRTKQSFKDECDINQILKKFERTGLIKHVAGRDQYGDFSELPDYQECLNVVLNAEQMFATVPAKIRSRFGNNPGEFIDFCSDEKNKEELFKMGLLREDVVLPNLEPLVPSTDSSPV